MKTDNCSVELKWEEIVIMNGKNGKHKLHFKLDNRNICIFVIQYILLPVFDFHTVGSQTISDTATKVTNVTNDPYASPSVRIKLFFKLSEM